MSNTLQTDLRDGVLSLTLNRPNVLNSFNREMAEALQASLGQAASGIGVKNGINAFGHKNFIGTFAPPFAVVNDFSFLATLGPRMDETGNDSAAKHERGLILGVAAELVHQLIDAAVAQIFRELLKLLSCVMYIIGELRHLAFERSCVHHAH